ncbi:MAG: MFS transporter [Planctomycetaceae bacterium]|jgi:nucleoside transporter|nr:MFS transporter [Planctomycetaceae bacterium]
MTESKGAVLVYPRLCVAYFLQFAIWGSWAGALGGYAEVLKMPGWQIGWLYAAIPLGAVISPLFIGPIADRYFAAQKVVSLLHFIGGLCLLGCGFACVTGHASFSLLMTLILGSGICFMPTIALVNSIVIKHSKEGSAPYVFVFGTIGWIVVNLFIAAFLSGAEQPYFFFAGGGAGILLALYSLTLPDTPPKGAPAAGEKNDVFGLGALKLFKDPAFAIFVACAFLASIPACNFFFAFQVTYLTQHGYPSPLALTTLNQFSELFFMSMLPLVIGIIGLKWVLVLGIGAWTLRYFVFIVPTFECAVIALLLHGFCYSFLYVAAYMYADKKAPAELKASVQSLMVFLLLGVGQVLGSQLYGFMRDLPDNAPKIAEMSIVRALNEDEIKQYSSLFVLPEGTPTDFWLNVKKNDTIPMPKWNDVKMTDSVWRYLDLGKTVTDLLKGNEQEQQAVDDLGSLLDTNKDNKISTSELAAAPEKLVLGNTEYTKTDIEKTFRNIANNTVNDFEVSRQDYLAVQAYNWKGILQNPAIFIAVFFVLFLILGKNPDDGKEKQKNEN